MSDVTVVLGPVAGANFPDQIQAIPGVARVVVPDTDSIGEAVGEHGILVTLQWSDDWVVPGLRWIQSVSAGTDQFPVERLREAGVVLTSAVGIHEVQVSEHAIGLLLAMTRGIGQAVRQQADRLWQWPPVIDLEGMTLAVLGLGVIGEAVAGKARAFGMRVIGTKRSVDDYEGAADAVFGPDQTVKVLTEADAAVITLPATDETAGLIGPAELEALRDGFLVNVGRGSIVDEEALAAAMRAGTLRGAALDVFAEEPLPSDSPLWCLPGVLITPHMAGLSPRYGERLAGLFARNLAAYRGEAEWVNQV